MNRKKKTTTEFVCFFSIHEHLKIKEGQFETRFIGLELTLLLLYISMWSIGLNNGPYTRIWIKIKSF